MPVSLHTAVCDTQQQSSVVKTETVRSTKPKTLTIGPFTEKNLPTPGLNNQNLLLYKARSSKCATPRLIGFTGQQNHQTSDSSPISTMQPHCISFIPRSAPLRVARWQR